LRSEIPELGSEEDSRDIHTNAGRLYVPPHYEIPGEGDEDVLDLTGDAFGGDQGGDITVTFDPNSFPGGSGCYRLWSCTNYFSIIYLGSLTVTLIVGLIMNGEQSCEKPLRSWAVVQSAIFLCQLFKNLCLQFNLSSLLAQPVNANLRRKITMCVAYLSGRVLNFVWFIWFIFGAIWTMEHSSDCPSEAPVIWATSLSVEIVQMASFGVIGLGLCCCCWFCCAMYFIAPHRFSQTKGASKNLIEKTTKKIKFTATDSDISPEDAVCAICLSEYVDGDELRYLPCSHHFHQECVDQWLLTNKSCASCRRVIDVPSVEIADTATVPAVENV